MAEATTQKATDEAKYTSEELRRSQQLTKTIETQLRSSKTELIEQRNEISRLENERSCLSSSLNEVRIISHAISCCNSKQATYMFQFHYCCLKNELTAMNNMLHTHILRKKNDVLCSFSHYQQARNSYAEAVKDANKEKLYFNELHNSVEDLEAKLSQQQKLVESARYIYYVTSGLLSCLYFFSLGVKV